MSSLDRQLDFRAFANILPARGMIAPAERASPAARHLPQRRQQARRVERMEMMP
jgi:hypothetical protein